MKPFFFLALCISVSYASLSLDNPLNTWLYHTETFGPLLSSKLPDTHAVNLEPESRSAWIWHLIHDRAESLIASGNIAGFGYSASGEALYASDEFQSRGGGMVEFQIEPLSWLSVHERMSVWTGSDGLPPDGFSSYHFGIEHGRHLYVDWGYAAATTGPLQVSLGRIPLRWGPGRFAQLLISGRAPSMDMLKIDFSLGSKVEFSGFTSTIDSDSSTWLSAHRLDIKPLENLRIGLSESILYTAGNIDLAYGNLLVPWYPIQWNEREDDNAFLTADCSYRPVKGLLLYGELLIDDIQYENIQNVPNKLGWTIGSDIFHPGTGVGGVVEYTAVQRYVYSQRKIVNYYLHDDRIIGCQLGPDAERVTAELSWCGITGITAKLQGSSTWQGQADVYEGWPDSVQTGGPFPSGIVETSTKLALDVGWYPNDWLELHLNGFISSTDNTAHVEGAESSDHGGGILVNIGQL